MSLAMVPAILGGSVILFPVATSAATAASCYISGNAPYVSYSQIRGRANRAGCGDQVLLKSYIKKDKSFWPDPTVGYGDKVVINGYVYGEGPCSREGHGTYYTAARTDTGQSSDGTHVANLC